MKNTFVSLSGFALIIVATLSGYLIFENASLALIWTCGLWSIYLLCSYIHQDAKAGQLSRVLFGAFVVLPSIAFTAISLLNQSLSDSPGMGERLAVVLGRAGISVQAVLAWGLVAVLFGGLLAFIARKR